MTRSGRTGETPIGKLFYARATLRNAYLQRSDLKAIWAIAEHALEGEEKPRISLDLTFRDSAAGTADALEITEAAGLSTCRAPEGRPRCADWTLRGRREPYGTPRAGTCNAITVTGNPGGGSEVYAAGPDRDACRQVVKDVLQVTGKRTAWSGRIPEPPLAAGMLEAALVALVAGGALTGWVWQGPGWIGEGAVIGLGLGGIWMAANLATCFPVIDLDAAEDPGTAGGTGAGSRNGEAAI